MAIRVVAEFVFTEDEFESLSFDKQGDIIENIFNHSDWDIEINKIELDEVNIDGEEESSDSDEE